MTQRIFSSFLLLHIDAGGGGGSTSPTGIWENIKMKNSRKCEVKVKLSLCLIK
jgi:hypothetical protein